MVEKDGKLVPGWSSAPDTVRVVTQEDIDKGYMG